MIHVTPAQIRSDCIDTNMRINRIKEDEIVLQELGVISDLECQTLCKISLQEFCLKHLDKCLSNVTHQQGCLSTIFHEATKKYRTLNDDIPLNDWCELVNSFITQTHLASGFLQDRNVTNILLNLEYRNCNIPNTLKRGLTAYTIDSFWAVNAAEEICELLLHERIGLRIDPAEMRESIANGASPDKCEHLFSLRLLKSGIKLTMKKPLIDAGNAILDEITTVQIRIKEELKTLKRAFKTSCENHTEGLETIESAFNRKMALRRLQLVS